jgi:drug/metabolite transporter (DMT)-like permease
MGRKGTYTVGLFADPMERKRMITSALMFAVATFFLWGTNNFLMGYAETNYHMDPKHFTAIMWITMGALGIVLYAYLSITGQTKTIHLDKNLAFPIVCGVLLGIGILTFSYAMGVATEMKGPMAAVATSNAVFTAILAFVFIKENLSIQQWAGIGAVILGMVLLRI